MGDILIDEVREGFRFNCESCGRCCKGKGEGFVFLYKDEIKSICKHLNLSYEDFLKKYTEIIEAEYHIINPRILKPSKRIVFLKSIVLKQDPNDGTCIFLDKDNKCIIYENRPNQCKSWPIWHSIVTNKEHFRNAKNKCIGFKSINEDSYKMITHREIIQAIKKEIQSEHKFIKKMKRNKNSLKKTYKFLGRSYKNLDKLTL